MVPIKKFQSNRRKMLKLSVITKKIVIPAVTSLMFLSIPASNLSQASTIKNGVSCAQADLKRKVGGKNYVCGKNPYVSPTKLTWMLRECPQTYDLYLESKDQYEIFKDILNSAGAEGKAEADKLLAGIRSLETLMKSQVCKRGK